MLHTPNTPTAPFSWDITQHVKANILIAKFMGYEVVDYQHNEYRPFYCDNTFAKTEAEEKTLWGGLNLQFIGRPTERATYPFDTDFNYLLPVIKRIEEQGYVVAIRGLSYQVYKVLDEQSPIVSLVCGDLSKKTQMTYYLVVSFIEHLNQN